MRRSAVGLTEVADWHNLTAAFRRAALGKRERPEVQRFAADLDRRLASMRGEILAATVRVGEARRFPIRDPKPRVIHAPCFRERVLHHALMAQVTPVLERALIADTFACRPGKGALAAVQRAQHHVRRWPWWVKVDVRAYFASIRHDSLADLLARRFKDRGLLALMSRIVAAHEDAPGRGLPIGALTSQQFANYYLGGLDRLLSADPRVRGMVRYMDDLVWWVGSRADGKELLAAVQGFVGEALGLELKTPCQTGPSAAGVSLCGYRVRPDRLLLSRRRKQCYVRCRNRWESAWRQGRIGAPALQAGYDTALAITLHADALAWRRRQLARAPVVEALTWV